MGAIFRRELKSYFTSPMGFVYLAVFYLFAGFYFFVNVILYSYADLTGIIRSMFTIIMFLIPILTMRLLSEDKKNKTDQALLTAPIKIASVVLGKFFAAFTVYLISCAIMLVFAIILASFTTLEWGVVLLNILGMVLVGAALIALGTFISSLTESQTIAVIVTFAAVFFLYFIDSLAANIQNEAAKRIILGFSFFSRYEGFMNGLLNYANVIFFVSVTALFLYYTTKVIERRRYIG